MAPAQALGRPLCSLVFVIGSLRGHRASLKEDLSGQEASKTAKKKPGVDEGLPRRGLSSLPCPPPRTSGALDHQNTVGTPHSTAWEVGAGEHEAWARLTMRLHGALWSDSRPEGAPS